MFRCIMFRCYNVQMYKAQLYNVQEGHLRNGDHLLQVGDVRLWGMGAQQVGSRAVNHLREVLQCPEKAPTRSFSLLNVPTSYAKILA